MKPLDFPHYVERIDLGGLDPLFGSLGGGLNNSAGLICRCADTKHCVIHSLA